MTLRQEAAISLAVAVMGFIVGCSGHLMVASGPAEGNAVKKAAEHRNEDTYNFQFQARIASALERIELQLRRIANKP